MKLKDFIVRFLVTFGVVFIANAIITACWSQFIKGNGWVIDWESSIRLAFILGFVIPLTQMKR